MSYYMVDLHIYSKSDQFVCQHWCQHALSGTHWGTILKCSLKLGTPFSTFDYISASQSSLLTSYLHRCWAAAREHQRKSRFMRVEYHYSQYQSFSPFHFSKSVARSKKLFNFTYRNQHEFQHFNWFGEFWCVLCETDLQWAQSTTEQLSEYIELDRNIAGSHSREALSFFDCIPRTSGFNSQRWLQRTDNAIWIWTTAANHSSRLERSQPADQSI